MTKTIEMGEDIVEDIVVMVLEDPLGFFGEEAVESGLVVEELESLEDEDDDGDDPEDDA